MNWIACKNQLPEISKSVIAYRPGGWIGVLDFDKDKKQFFTEGFGIMGTTHWMDFPERPNEMD